MALRGTKKTCVYKSTSNFRAQREKPRHAHSPLILCPFMKRRVSQVVPLQFYEFWTPNRWLSKQLIFILEDLRLMGTCIKFVTTISLNFCQTFEKVGKLRSNKKFVQTYSTNMQVFSSNAIPKRRSIQFICKQIDWMCRRLGLIFLFKLYQT